MHVETSVDIVAPPERVWDVMTDVERWPEWTSSVERVERLDDGRFGIGSRARIRQPRFPPVVWEVTEFEPGRSFSWAARNLALTSTGRHSLTPRPEGGVTVTLRLDQDGPLAPVLALVTEALVRRYVEMEANGLKRRCEA